MKEFEADVDLVFFGETLMARFGGLAPGAVLEDAGLPGVRLEVQAWSPAGGTLRLTAPNVYHVALGFGEAKGVRVRRDVEDAQHAVLVVDGSVGAEPLEVTQRSEPARYATTIRARDLAPTAP